MNNIDNINKKIYRFLCKTCYYEIFSIIDKYHCFNCTNKIEEVEVPDREVLLNPVNSVQPNSIIITSSFNYLNPSSYKESDILHIGVSNSNKVIYNFWFKYNKDSEESSNIWNQVLNIPINKDDLKIKDNNKSSLFMSNTNNNNINSNTVIEDLFDEELEKSFQEQTLNYPKYDQLNNNCYAFIYRFLNKINFKNKNDWTKETLADSVLKEKVIEWEYYCYAYRELNRKLQETNGKSLSVTLKYKPKKVEVVVHVCDMCGEIADDGSRYKCSTCGDYDLCVQCYFDYGHTHEMNLVDC
jgi:hypothetical protein